MAPRSARSPKGRQVEIDDDAPGFGMFLARHRRTIGGLTAFTVAFSYVAANALWYQPHAHGGALFATRPSPASTRFAGGPDGDVQGTDAAIETIIRLEKEAAGTAPQDDDAAMQTASVRTPEHPPTPRAAPSAETAPTVAAPAPAATPAGDAVVMEVQGILAELNLYNGPVDGLTGPQTRGAIENYRRIVGIAVSPEIDDQLLRQLGAKARIAAAQPAAPVSADTPAAAPAPAPSEPIEVASAAPVSDPLVMRIQAGLKAFGNDGIEIDGVVGSRTRSAILEFQSLFGLPETGEPDEALYAKMREIGLTN